MINVLIVDDEKIEREGLKFLISTETKENKIFEASNGREALQILREEGYTASSYRHQNAAHGQGWNFPKGKGRTAGSSDHHIQWFQRLCICAGSNTLWCHGYPETGKSRGFSPSDPACGE